MADAGKRGYTAGKFAIEVDGINAGWVNSAEGGNAKAEVVIEKVGVDHLYHKHIGGVKYEDITVNCGTGMSRAFYDWIKASFDKKYVRKNGAIIACDYDYKEVSRLDFFNGLITEIGFPALDAGSKDAAKMTIKFAPEYTKVTTKPGAQVAPSKYSLGKGEQKKWLPANFSLSIDNLDLTRTNKVEALVLKQKVVENAVGELRTYEKEPANVEFPNVAFTLAESHAEKLYQWHESFVINGNNGPDQERNGALTYLASDTKTPLFTLQFFGLGIFTLTPEKVEAGSETIRRVKAECYCHEIKFNYENGSAWA